MHYAYNTCIFAYVIIIILIYYHFIMIELLTIMSNKATFLINHRIKSHNSLYVLTYLVKK